MSIILISICSFANEWEFEISKIDDVPRYFYHWTDIKGREEIMYNSNLRLTSQSSSLFRLLWGLGWDGYRWPGSFFTYGDSKNPSLLHAWSNPIGGIGNGGRLYPESRLDDSVSRVLLRFEFLQESKAIKIVINLDQETSNENRAEALESVLNSLIGVDFVYVEQRSGGHPVVSEWLLLSFDKIKHATTSPLVITELFEELIKLGDHSFLYPVSELHMTNSLVNDIKNGGRSRVFSAVSKFLQSEVSERPSFCGQLLNN